MVKTHLQRCLIPTYTHWPVPAIILLTLLRENNSPQQKKEQDMEKCLKNVKTDSSLVGLKVGQNPIGCWKGVVLINQAMGSECKKCLKDLREEEIEIFKQKVAEFTDDQDKRVTRYVNTGFFSMNTSFFVSTERVEKLRVQYLVIYTDSLDSLLENCFIKEMKESNKLFLDERIRTIKEKVKFNEPGDYVNIVNPFPKLMIQNLLIGWLGLLERSSNELKISICKSFDQIVPSSSTSLSMAITEISPGLGFNCRQFQKLILRKVWQLSKSESGLKVYYLTRSVEAVEGFIGEIMASRASLSSHSSTNKSLLSNESSNYF